MISSPSCKMPKSRLNSDYDSEDEAKSAQATTINAPRKAKSTTSDSLIEQLVQMLTANQSHSQQILQERVELTELAKGLGKTEVNAPNLKKLTKESFIELADLYEGCD